MQEQESVLHDYRRVREDVGYIDRSEAGKIAIRGADRFTWLQGMVSADVRRLEAGAVARLDACLLDATGHLLSDATLLTLPGDALLMELPRQNLTKILSQLDRFLIMEEVELEDVSDQIGCLSAQGRNAPSLEIPLFVGGLLQVAADHTGEGGIDWYAPRERVQEVLATALGQELVVAEAQEILRVEAGIPKYGADMDESVIALEANLGATHISFTKGCYVGQEIIARIDSRGHTNRALTGLVLEEGALPVPHDRLFAPPTENDAKPRETGRITSVTPHSPALKGKTIALGYVRHEHRTPGLLLRIEEQGREATLRVVELPFYTVGVSNVLVPPLCGGGG